MRTINDKIWVYTRFQAVVLNDVTVTWISTFEQGGDDYISVANRVIN